MALIELNKIFLKFLLLPCLSPTPFPEHVSHRTRQVGAEEDDNHTNESILPDQLWASLLD